MPDCEPQRGSATSGPENFSQAAMKEQESLCWLSTALMATVNRRSDSSKGNWLKGGQMSGKEIKCCLVMTGATPKWHQFPFTGIKTMGFCLPLFILQPSTAQLWWHLQDLQQIQGLDWPFALDSLLLLLGAPAKKLVKPTFFYPCYILQHNFTKSP